MKLTEIVQNVAPKNQILKETRTDYVSLQFAQCVSSQTSIA